MPAKLAVSGRLLAENKVLLLVLGIQAGLIIFRTLNLYLTGFLTADESNYLLNAAAGQAGSTRYFFDYQLTALFRLFSIDSVTRLLVFFPFYLAFWSFSFLILAYKTVGLITENRRAKDLTIFSVLFAVSYSLLSVGLLSEDVGLTMCMGGVYAWLRYERVEKKWYYAAGSGIAFIAAAFSREPYVIFPIMAALAWILMAARRRVPIRHAALFVAVSLIITTAPDGAFFSAYHQIQTFWSHAGASGQPSYYLPAMAHSAGVPVLANIGHDLSGIINPTGMTPRVQHIGSATAVLTRGIARESQSGDAVLASENPSSLGLAPLATPEAVTTLLVQSLTNSVLLFLIGIALGWNPVLLVFGIVGFLMMLRARPFRGMTWLLVFIILLSLATFYGDVVTLYSQSGFYLGQGLSALIRLTNTTIPAYILMAPKLFDKLSARRIKLLAAILVAFTVGGSAFYVSAVQTNFRLPYNVISFGNVNAPLEAREYLQQNTIPRTQTVVFMSAGWAQAQLYLQDMPDTVVFPTAKVLRDYGIMRNYSYSFVRNFNYTDDIFVSLRPSTFYILSENNLTVWNTRASLQDNVQRLMAYNSLFLFKAYGILFNLDTSHYQTPYAIDSVQIVFSSSSGHMLKVQVSWPK